MKRKSRLNSPKSPTSLEQRKSPTELPAFWNDRSNWVAVATILIAIANIVYTVFSGIQWTVMRGQLNEMRSSSRQGQIVLDRELRPYVLATKLYLSGEVKDGQMFYGEVEITNSGARQRLN